jgi:outer membrane protein assembly factor BamD (BamD/ComL family)
MRDSKNSKNLKQAYEQGFKQYQKGNFQKALKIFSSIKNDAPSLLLIERIKLLQKDRTLRKNWNGVWSWLEK